VLAGAGQGKAQKAFDVERNGSDKPFSEAELKNALSNVEAVFPAVTDAINAKGLSAESMGVVLSAISASATATSTSRPPTSAAWW